MKTGAILYGIFLLALCGCDQLPSVESVMAGIPDEFTETAGDAKITPISDKKEGFKDKKTSLKFSQTPGIRDPFIGAELRLKRDLVAGNPSYKDFLLPKIILESRSQYRMGVTVNMGGSAKEIRTIVPSGAFYIGILPSFDQSWVAQIGDGGAVNVDMRVEGRWSKLRTEDVICGGRFSASSPFHLPLANLNPLLASLVEPSAENLPQVGLASRGKALLWMENAYYRFSALGFSTKEDKIQNGWITLRPWDEAVSSASASRLELAVFFASAAFRDGVPCWFAFGGEDIFLMMGALPPSESSYVFSTKTFLEKGDTDDFYSVLEKSRQDYVNLVTEGTKIHFLDTKERGYFYDLPKKPRVEDKTNKQEGEQSVPPAVKNPFVVQ
jgi:hypothetical protein